MTEDSGQDSARQDMDRLIPFAYDELRRLARNRVAQLPRSASLSATDLVNEVLLRLLKRSNQQYNGTDHLVRTAALAMHDTLVDRARRNKAAKRSSGLRQVEFADDIKAADPTDQMLLFDEACGVVRACSEAHFELFLLRVYAGLSKSEIAAQRGQSKRTVERQWTFVKSLLAAHMDGDGQSSRSRSTSSKAERINAR